ncbi:phage minor head protein [Acinetobacter venetianus]|uniref:phage minor head protein n=1 Tax=Acinetobacter venetianus TaxID=52133 RepID=UPI0028A04E6D|nr:phage minor head protein [Acinetobacter venetianus]
MTILTNLKPLIQQAHKSKLGRKSKSQPIFVSKKTEIEYYKTLLAISRLCQKGVIDEIEPMLKYNMGDSIETHIADGVFSSVKNALENLKNKVVSSIELIATQVATQIVIKQKQASDKQIGEILLKATGLDFTGLMRDEDLQSAVEDAIAANVRLIRSIPGQYFDLIEGAILTGLQTGQRAEFIKQEILKIGKSTDSRALLIAVDQLGKINGRLTQIRQQKLGITHYTWSTSQDERVRHSHRLRDGLLFAWDDPPDDGHPGIPIRCRCVAIPYTKHLFDKNAPSPEQLMAEQKGRKSLVEQQNEDLLGWLNKNQISKISNTLQNDKSIQMLAEEYKLTLPEQVALRHYTGEGYRNLNQMWNGLIKQGDPLYSELVLASKVLGNALDRLPNHVGQVVRRTKLPDEFLALHQVGERVEYKAFTSTTYGESDVFSHYPHRLMIKSKTGKNVNFISEYKDEEYEVVFNRPKHFRVKDRRELPNGVIEIELWEIDE